MNRASEAKNRIVLADIGREPFRVFFPAAVLAGVTGVTLWPLYFSGLTKFYPGQSHARIMAQGLFGGFILGFLGTAMPRMLSAAPLGVVNVLVLLTLYGSMTISLAIHRFTAGGSLFVGLLSFFIVLMLLRARKREDNPPPGFVLVALAILCALAGGILSILEPRINEEGAYWVALGRRLTYRAFVLLPILGIGPFLLPRFFGLQSAQDFPQSRAPSRAWIKKASLALAAGLLIVASIFIELKGW